jgi:hypothetical protein
MLSIRLAIVTVAAGLCLWGLFSLLDTLKQPALLRSAKATIVKGCDSLESEDAKRLCPALFCMKAVLGAKLVDAATPLTATVDKHDGLQHRLIAGNAGAAGAAGAQDMRHFACLLDGTHVVAAKLVQNSELQELAGQSADWSL